jgi:hypothetical protein
MDSFDQYKFHAAVNQCARQPSERLALLIPRFNAERFLYDYVTPDGLAYRLNQVLKRVKLTPLDDSAITAISAGRIVVEQRIDDLLPPERFSAAVPLTGLASGDSG